MSSPASTNLAGQGLGTRLAFVLATCLLVAACSQDPRRHVIARLMDQGNGVGSVSAPPNTARDPYITIANETRPVLSMPHDTFSFLTRPHGEFTVEVPPGSVLDFGFGVRVDGTFDPDVEFVVAANTNGEVRTIFRRAVTNPDGGANVWHDARVDVGTLSGTVTLSFSSQSASLGLEQGRGSAAAYFSEPVITAPGQAEDRPNVIVISLDTLSAKHLGMYGYERDTSPNLDRLFSRDGIIVDRFYANAVATDRSHAAMLTGCAPLAVLDATAGIPRISAAAVTLAEALRVAGYRTAAFTEDAFVSAALGFHRGFEVYNEETSFELGTDAAEFVEQTLGRGLAWVETHRTEPFFLFLHTYQVHNPYLPQQADLELFPIPPDADEASRDTANYDREIRYVDREVAGFIDALDRMALRENTLLVITADHGEEFGEHGRRYHGATLHDETLRVPLLLRAPRLLPSGERRSGPMSLVDLTPTVLGLLGLAPHNECDGTNRMNHLVTGTPSEKFPIFHEANSPFTLTYAGMDDSWIRPSYAITLWPHRAVRIRTPTGARCAIYDLENDPGEHSDVSSGGDPDHVRVLCSRLDEYEAASAAKADRLRRNAATGVSAGVDGSDDLGRDPAWTQRLEKLKALGYVQ